MDIKRKASEGIVAIPAKKSKNEVALRYGTRSDFDENVSSQHGGAENREIVPEIEYLLQTFLHRNLCVIAAFVDVIVVTIMFVYRMFSYRELNERLICKHRSCCYQVTKATFTVQSLLPVDSF